MLVVPFKIRCLRCSITIVSIISRFIASALRLPCLSPRPALLFLPIPSCARFFDKSSGGNNEDGIGAIVGDGDGDGNGDEDIDADQQQDGYVRVRASGLCVFSRLLSVSWEGSCVTFFPIIFSFFLVSDVLSYCSNAVTARVSYSSWL